LILWQETVAGLMDRARLVVFRAGAGDGLAWEIEQAGRRLQPWQIIVIVPFGKKKYERFRPSAEQALGRALPDHPGVIAETGMIDGIVRFRDDGSPKFVTLKKSGFFRTRASNPLVSQFNGALRAVFRQQGVAWSKPPVNLARLYVVGMLLLAVLGGAVVLGLILTGQMEASAAMVSQ